MPELSTEDLLEAALRCQYAGDLAQAQSLLRQILARDADDPDALQLLGLALAQSGQPQEGLRHALRAAQLNPDAPDAHASLADVYELLARHDQAIEEYQHALRLKPDLAEVHCKLGRAYHAAGQFKDAADSHRRALAIQPDYPDALLMFANALRSQGDLPQSIDYYRRCIAIAPHNAHVHYNLATALELNRQPEQALESYRHAIDGKLEMAHAKYGMLLLSLGRWTEGWQELEWVDWYERQLTGKPRFPQALWDGSPAPGKTLLIYEGWGGMGDVLQFVRFIPRVLDMGLQVILESPEPLVELLRHSLSPAQVVAQNSPLPSFDLCLPLESLPHRLKITPENLAPSVPYLAPPPDRVAKWSAKSPPTV